MIFSNNYSNNYSLELSQRHNQWPPSVKLTENEARNSIYNQIEYMILEDLSWSNDLIYADHEETDRFLLTKNDFTIAMGIQQLRDMTHIVFDEFEYGVRWKVLPNGVDKFSSYDGCFTLQYKIPKLMYSWSSPYIHPFNIDDEHTIWF
jgi:hypothetical protein